VIMLYSVIALSWHREFSRESKYIQNLCTYEVVVGNNIEMSCVF
jgi:hypothetical protein